VSPALLHIACLRRVDSGSFGRRLIIIFGQNEKLVQISKSAFCAHETQYFQTNGQNRSVTAAAVQKMGT
jgi:hypothetical protein